MKDQIAAVAEEIAQKFMSRQTVHGHTLSEQSAACVVQDVLRKHFAPAASDDTPWNSVDERLPADRQLVWWGGGNTSVAGWYQTSSDWPWRYEGGSQLLFQPTHWKPREAPVPPAAPLSAEQRIAKAVPILERAAVHSGNTQVDRLLSEAISFLRGE